jgi:hypothetical protein
MRTARSITSGENLVDLRRPVGAMQCDERSLQRRYMQLEGVQSLSDYQFARLTAVIN